MLEQAIETEDGRLSLNIKERGFGGILVKQFLTSPPAVSASPVLLHGTISHWLRNVIQLQQNKTL